MRSLHPLITRGGAHLPFGLDYDDLAACWGAAIAEGVQIEAPVQHGAWTRLA